MHTTQFVIRRESFQILPLEFSILTTDLYIASSGNSKYRESPVRAVSISAVPGLVRFINRHVVLILIFFAVIGSGYLIYITDSRIISREQFNNGAPQYLILFFTYLDIILYFLKLHSPHISTKNEFRIS